MTSHLEQLLSDGWKVQISEQVVPDTQFVWEEDKFVVFHPLNYHYSAYEDIFEAHAKNMEWIQKQIDDSAAAAIGRLNAMVDYFDHKFDPVKVQIFAPMLAHDNGDGTFTFTTDIGEAVRDKYSDHIVPREDTEGIGHFAHIQTQDQ